MLDRIRNLGKTYWRKGKDAGFFHLLTSNAISKVLGVLFIFAIARYLPSSDVGRINIMLATMTVLTTLGNFGTTTSILKLCSENVSLDVIEQYFVDGTLLNVVFSVLTFVGALILVKLEIITSDALLIRMMPIFFLVVISTTLNSYFFAYFQARQQIVFISKLQASLKLTSIGTVIITTLIWKLPGFVYGYVVTDLVALGVYVLLVRNRVTQRHLNWDRARVARIFHLSKFGAFANSLGQLLQYLDTMILSALRTDLSSIGHYSVAQYFMVGANQLTYTINQVAVPKLSFRSDNAPSWKAAFSEYQKTFRWVTLGIVILLAVVSPVVIIVLIGSTYTIAIVYLFILLVGFAARGLMVPYSIAVWSLGRLDYNFYSSLFAAALNAVLNVVLILSFGALGASCATSVAYILAVPVFRHFMEKEVHRRDLTSWVN